MTPSDSTFPGPEEREIDRLKERLDEYRREIRRRDEMLAASSPAAIAEQVTHGMDAERDRLRGEVARLTKEKNGAYSERNACVALLARMAVALGLKAGIGAHDAADTAWEPDWRTIVFIELPSGQVSWHLHDTELALLAGLPAYAGAWDGHDTPTKYRRMDGTALLSVATLRAERDALALRLAETEEAAIEAGAEAIRLMVAAETERCALIAEGWRRSVHTGRGIAAAIRASTPGGGK